MNMEITRETKILAEVNKQAEPTRGWMQGAISELGNAPGRDAVTSEHVTNLLSKYPDRKSFEDGAERYIKYNIYGLTSNSDPIAFNARKEAAEACLKLEKIIYG